MSTDGIGGSGGSGGGGFDIGGMLGGLLGGGKSGGAQGSGGGGGGLQGILDPLGLIPALVGGIGKMLKGGDASQISEEGKLINQNKLASFEDKLGTTPPITQQPVEFKPSTDDSRAKKGYAPPNVGQMDPVSQDAVSDHMNSQSGGRTQNSQALTGDPQRSSDERERASSSSAATATQTPEQKKAAEERAAELKTMKVISANIDAFDQNDPKDGLFDRRNIEQLVAFGETKEIRDAAIYLLEHPDLMLDLEVATGRGHGLLSLDAVKARLLILLGSPAASPTTQAGAAANDPAGQTNSRGVTNIGQGTHPDPTHPAGNQATNTTSGGKPASLDQKLGDMSTNLDAMQDRLSILLDKEAAAALPGGTALTAAEKKELAMLPTQLQRAGNRLSEMHTLVSNLMAAYHEMSMTSIGHIR